MRIRDGTHDRADSQAVEIVVDEDEDTQHKGGKHRTHAGMDVLLRPAAEGGTAACGVDQRDDDAQQHKEKEDAGVVGNGGDQTVVDDGIQRGDRVEAGHQQRAQHDAQKQRAVRLLGDQRQRDGEQRRHQGPEGIDKHGVLLPAGFARNKKFKS